MIGVANMAYSGWRKSTFSANDANCVEVAWIKSSFSANDSNCVEMAWRGSDAGIRDSKAPEVGSLTVPPTAFASLIGHTKRS
ncbi:DUF397 domain-containing protein [Alloactinosynnema sp. L-07]|uniref:DUF397 domain-containing protein n=1 Tax=Alloactinosynnema sp. L-07 TaxID=1653480 RepID=UPI001E42F291|nr:DUF397 domain-containing protein [Alloactinosynnema sp. L-07]